MSEPTYTLAEAQAVLARRECNRYGHEYAHISEFGGALIRIICDRCGKAWTAAEVTDTEGS